MCYKYARLVNEELSLPPRSEYFRPPPFMGLGVVPEPPRLVEDPVVVFPAATEWYEDDLSLPWEDTAPPEHPEPLFVRGGVATYVSRGRAYRGPAPPAFLPPRGHGAGGSSLAQRPEPQVGRGRAARIAAFLHSLRNPGPSRR